MVRLQAHPFTVCGRWQEDMIHSALCSLMRTPYHLSVYFLSSVLLPPLSASHHFFLLFPFHPSFSLDFLPSFFRGMPVSITHPVSSRDRIWVIGAAECVSMCVCVCGWKMVPSLQTELSFPLPPNEVWLVSCGELDGQLQPPSFDTHLLVTLYLLPSALLSQSIDVRVHHSATVRLRPD